MNATPSRSQGGDTLAALRAEIDALDRRLVGVLAERMAVVDRVIARKREEGLPALIPNRVEEVVARVRAEASATGVPPDLAEAIWRRMMEWVIDYEAAHLT